MTKEEGAKILAIKYVLDLNTFSKCEKLRRDLADINFKFRVRSDGKENKDFDVLFEKYRQQLEKCGRDRIPHWARVIMAERYSLNI